MATNESYKGKDGEWKENTQWHNVKAWGKLAELVSQNLQKESEVVVEGKLVNENCVTKNGEKRYSTSVNVSDFLLISPRNKQE
jgi:single-strand DNA-binding protein